MRIKVGSGEVDNPVMRLTCPALRLAVAGMVVAGCSGSTPTTTSSDPPPRPIDKITAAALLTSADLPGWDSVHPGGPRGGITPTCVPGALAHVSATYVKSPMLLLEHAVRFDTAAHASAYFTVYTTRGGCDEELAARLTRLHIAPLGDQSAAQIYTDPNRALPATETAVVRSGTIVLTLTMDAAQSVILERMAATAATVAEGS